MLQLLLECDVHCFFGQVGKAIMNRYEKAPSVDKVGSHSPLNRPLVGKPFYLRILVVLKLMLFL
jgi:hypothetical protein